MRKTLTRLCSACWKPVCFGRDGCSGRCVLDEDSFLRSSFGCTRLIGIGYGPQVHDITANKDNILPLKRGGLTVAVMGPNANDSVMQWGNYNGMPSHTVTILDGIRNALGADDKLIYEQGCSWVERTLIQSVFNQCKSADGQGFTARYWNNVKHEGTPVTTTQVTTPFRFCTSGATVLHRA